MITTFVIIFLLALALHAGLQVHRARAEARAAISEAWQAVVGLSDVARVAHELTLVEKRTAVSMGRADSFVNERNPTMRAAKMRGYEVWRNEQIEPVQRQLRAAYERYEFHVRKLIELVKGGKTYR